MEGKMLEQFATEEFGLSEIEPISIKELIEILGLTIKKDEQNKVITFLCLLSAYTEESQFNISFNAPSSTGKSYIPTEIAKLFPDEDVIEVGYCSPTAFFHDKGFWDAENKRYFVDLSRKILIFLDQPHSQLLHHLRPLLSHDKKEIQLKITDKVQKFGLKTKNILLKGFPSVIFCTAGLKIDQQESTRFLLLSPETSSEKIREAIHLKIRKEANSETYQSWLEENPKRKLLKARIQLIKQANIKNISLDCPEKIEQEFFKRHTIQKPRHQRDIGRIISLVKALALLNFSFRERDGSMIVASEQDIEESFEIWDEISEAQEFDLPPYILHLFKEVILPAFNEKNKVEQGFEETKEPLGLTRQEVTQKHFRVYGRVLPDWSLRQQIIPMLENCGLITQEPDPDDRRRMLIYPTTSLNIFKKENNSELNGRVKGDDGLT